MKHAFTFITAVLLVALPALPAAETKAGKLNILLVLSDDHSAPHVGCYGNAGIKTPNLDQFAAQGLRCDRAYVSCPQCVPSRAAIFTGRSPVAIAMSRFSAPLPRDIKTYPEALRAAGWFTGVAGRTYHMDGAANSPESRAVFDKYKLTTFADRLDYVKTAGGNEPSLAQFRDFLDLKPQNKPFFLQLCSNDPHRPLNTCGPEKHDPAKIKLPAHYPDTKLVREDFARYYDEIAHFDVFFGEVLAELDKRGLADNTLVAFMGDNGCSQFRGKGTLYEFGIHVPLLVRWPGKIKPGSSTSELISAEDLAPTFLEAAGLPVPAEMTGRSFVKLLRGEPFEGRKYVFAERGAHGSGLPQHSSAFDLGRVVVSPTHKLIYNATWQLPYHPVDFAGDAFWKELEQMHQDGKLDPKLDRLYFSATRPMFELFDLQADPSEFHNLAGTPEAAAVERELKAALHEWMILERDFVPLPIAPEAKGAKQRAAKPGSKRKMGVGPS
jgi:arylsulfatase A-like enzyme